ncbi:hypothetical protein, partial [Candidatus Magnetominusculus xianensis]|uniref:hypothetical protein n=1 Tax=Candidatus Magnetominusculus xianensis TaxID=1748249 RepID=UPI001F2C299B
TLQVIFYTICYPLSTGAFTLFSISISVLGCTPNPPSKYAAAPNYGGFRGYCTIDKPISPMI